MPYRELCALALLDGNENFELEAEEIRIRIASEFQAADYAKNKKDSE